MILVTAGTSSWDFSRLIRGMDEIAAQSPEPVVMQVGHTSYRPRNAAFFGFTSHEKLHRLYRKCSIMVSHCSPGPLLAGRRYAKPLVLVPRDHRRGETVDAHQIETAPRIQEANHMVQIVHEICGLEEAVRDALEKSRRGLTYENHPGKQSMVAAIRTFVDSLNHGRRGRLSAHPD